MLFWNYCFFSSILKQKAFGQLNHQNKQHWWLNSNESLMKINQSSWAAHLVCLPLRIKMNYNSFETKWHWIWSKSKKNVYSMIQSHIFYVRQSWFQEVVWKFNRTILQNACCSGVYSGRVQMTNGPGRCFDLWNWKTAWLWPSCPWWCHWAL